MTVPKTSVYEDDCFQSRKNDIGLAGKIAAVDPETEPFPMQKAPNYLLRLGVAPTNSGHHAASGYAVYDICH